MLFSLGDRDIFKRTGTLAFNDQNPELITTYEVVRDHPDELIDSLARHQNTPEYFKKIRAWDRSSGYKQRRKIDRASRLIYLNKTAYNGLYRVNGQGLFNVPFGNYSKPKIVDVENLRACSTLLQDVWLSALDFGKLLGRISCGDMVYLDPPYSPLSATSSFTAYTKDGFDQSEQERLKDFCVALDSKGAKFLLSNSGADWVQKLYKGHSKFLVEEVFANRAINSQAKGRGKVKEILVRNYS